MSQLNLFQRFTQEQDFRSHLPLSHSLSAILDYCEYAIHVQFNERAKQKYKKKNRKRDISEEFLNAFRALNREEKVEYYIRVVGYLHHFVKDNYVPPKPLFSGVMNDIGFARSFNVKRWKEKKLRLDQDRHLMFAERETKIKTYDMKDYLLRLSKTKQYYCFVLQAVNNNPPQKSRTVHIGFNDKGVFQRWHARIKFSTEFREWELYRFLYSKTAQSVIDRSEILNNSFMSESVKETLNMIQTNKSLDSSIDEQYEKPVMLQTIKKVEFDFSNYNQSSSTDQQSSPKAKQKKQMEVLSQQIKQFEVKKENANPRKTLVDQLIDGEIFQQPDVFEQKIEEEDEQSKQQKKNMDLFHKLYPEYELEELELYTNFSIIHEEQNFKIYQNQVLQKRLKMIISFEKSKYSLDQIISMISKAQTLKSLNENIQQMQVKTNIPSQNSALLYMVLKPFNRLYRSRDFIFIRHVFRSGSNIYMIDKSIQNSNYPPFMTIVRGQLCVVYGIFERQSKYELIVDTQITNEGLLNLSQETHLTLKYLKAFNKLSQAEVEANSYKFFDLSWDINKNQTNKLDNQIRMRRKTINEITKKISNESDKNQQSPSEKNFTKKNPHQEREQIKSSEIRNEGASNSSNGSPYDHKSTSLSPSASNKSPHLSSEKKIEHARHPHKQSFETVSLKSVEQSPNHVAVTETIIRKLNAEGFIIVDKSYLKQKYIQRALQKEKVNLKVMSSSEGHPIWKNEWIHDDKEGGLIFIHKKKIEDQKGVLKFVLSKMAKNFVSGQSVLSISLPVDIFNCESNLQRFLFGMTYGPTLFEGMQKESPISKLLKTVIFGITNSVLYLSMEKPFNPILGQTFQCWINGCPAYAEQISHHPPIGALFFKGRGYDVTAQLQSKVSLGMNTGTGTNEGIYKVSFADKTEVCFITPGGEISGLSHGDRKFNLIGKSHYWIANSNIVLQLTFDPCKRSFFSVSKQEQPPDYFEGSIWEVKPEFMTKFLNGKRKQPEQKDRLRNFGKVSGIWNKYLKYNNEQIFNFDKQFPLTLEFEPNPLPSDSNWREDIEYRRRNQVTRAQTEKERLEVLQRKDKKLREKFHKKK